MTRGDLYIMVGIPGSGKSSYVKQKCNNDDNSLRVSRDEIRYNILKENDAYFSKEKEVFNQFIQEINRLLHMGFTVYADATHINEVSRAKVINNIDDRVIGSLNAIYMNTPYSICKIRNEKRYGREKVPEKVIDQMFKKLTKPTKQEGFDNIFIVETKEV